MSVFTVAALIARIVCGNLIDRKGARNVSLAAAALFGVSNILFVLVPYLNILMGLRIFQGISYAALGTASGAAVAKILPENDMSKGLFVFGLGQSVALCAGPYIALSLARANDFSLVYYSAAAIILITFPLSLVCRYPDVEKNSAYSPARLNTSASGNTKGFKKIFLDHFEVKAIKPFIVQVSTSIGVAFTVFYLSYYSADKDYANAKMFFLFASIAMICLRVFLSRFLAGLKRVQILSFGYFFGITSLIIVAFTGSETVFILGGICYGLFHGSIGPVLQAISVETVPPSRRGAATGTYYFAVDVGIGIGSALWGFLIDRTGFLVTISGAITFFAIAIALSWIFFGRNLKSADS